MGEHTHGHAYRYTHGESVRHAAGAEARSVNTQLPVRDKLRMGWGGWGRGSACLASHLMHLPELPRGSLCKVQCFRTAWAPCPTLKGLFYLQEWSSKFSQSDLGCG